MNLLGKLGLVGAIALSCAGCESNDRTLRPYSIRIESFEIPEWVEPVYYEGTVVEKKDFVDNNGNLLYNITINVNGDSYTGNVIRTKYSRDQSYGFLHPDVVYKELNAGDKVGVRESIIERFEDKPDNSGKYGTFESFELKPVDE